MVIITIPCFFLLLMTLDILLPDPHLLSLHSLGVWKNIFGQGRFPRLSLTALLSLALLYGPVRLNFDATFPRNSHLYS